MLWNYYMFIWYTSITVSTEFCDFVLVPMASLLPMRNGIVVLRPLHASCIGQLWSHQAGGNGERRSRGYRKIDQKVFQRRES